MKSLRVILFGCSLLLLSIIFSHYSPNTSRQIPHPALVGAPDVSGMVSAKNTYQETCKISRYQRHHTMSERDFKFWLTVLGGLVAGVIGIITGLVLNWIQRRIERDSRIRNFWAEMSRIKHQAEFSDNLPRFCEKAFPSITYQVSLIRNDFPKNGAELDDYITNFRRLDILSIKKESQTSNINYVMDSFIGFAERHHIRKEGWFNKIKKWTFP